METLFDDVSENSFEQFLRDCPDVYPAFLRIARTLKAKGHKRYSADGIGHVIRWEMATANKDCHGFKINNNHIAALARKAMAENPDLAGFFETRKVKGSL